MSRDSYFEMCEMLGSEPIESEIPVEMEDLPDEVQEAFNVYSMLQDVWDTMSGIYMGKNFVGLSDIMNIMQVDDHRACFMILGIIDRQRSIILNNKKPTS